MIQLKEVTPQNFEEIINLEVLPPQKDWVAPNVRSLAEAKVFPALVPLAVYAGAVPVGFGMYGLDKEDGEYWLCRLMIAAEHQGKGYGRQALEQLLARIRREPAYRGQVFLGVERENEGAVLLYQSMGFEFDGRVLEGERIMRRCDTPESGAC